MVTIGESVGGDWHGWLNSIRAQIGRDGLADWSACDGEITTATYTGREGQAVVLAVVRWNHGEIACLGEVFVPDIPWPNPSGPPPGPGEEVSISTPAVGATFALSS